MTTKEVKRYLLRARNVKRQLAILEQAERNVVEDNVQIVPPYEREYVDSSSISKPTEEEALRLDDLRARIRNKKIEYTDILFDRIELIDSALPIASLDNMILKERYINSLSWNGVAKAVLYSAKYLMERILVNIFSDFLNGSRVNPQWERKIKE